MKYYLLIFYPLIIFCINNFFKKKKFIPNFSGEKHQKILGTKSIPLSGGLYLLCGLAYIFHDQFILFGLFFFLIFIIGFVSDLKLLSSPKLRFLFQSILIFTFIYYSKLNIESTRIFILDITLQNFFLSCLFTSFCLMIVVNGTNFIDGLNALVLSYYLILLLVLFKLGLLSYINVDNQQIIFLSALLFVLIILNISNQLYLGDSGAYSLGFLFGFILISIYQNHQYLSPFFIVLLLWYPAFETLFSIIRKLFIKKSPIQPDSSHLHQLLFFFIKKHFLYSPNISNNLSSFLIITYNLVIFIFGMLDIYHSGYQIFLIFLNIIIYSIVYSRLILFQVKSNVKIKKNP